MFERDVNGKDFCAFFGPATTINEEIGSCNYYSHGEPEKEKIDVPWLSIFTKIQLGYAENRPGFSCKRCSHFGVGKNDCNFVDKSSPGDTAGEINPNACCSLWTRDPKRGGLSDEALVKILSAKPVVGLRELAGATKRL